MIEIGLDADAAVLADSLAQIIAQEIDQLFGPAGSFFPLDARVYILGILPKDDHVHSLGMADWRRHAVEIADRAHTGVEIQRLSEGHIETPKPTTHGSRQRAFDGTTEITNGLGGILWQPLVVVFFRLLSRVDLHPGHRLGTVIGLLDSAVENVSCRPPDIGADAIALDERNDRSVRDLELSIRPPNLLAVRWWGHLSIALAHALITPLLLDVDELTTIGR